MDIENIHDLVYSIKSTKSRPKKQKGILDFKGYGTSDYYVPYRKHSRKKAKLQQASKNSIIKYNKYKTINNQFLTFVPFINRKKIITWYIEGMTLNEISNFTGMTKISLRCLLYDLVKERNDKGIIIYKDCHTKEWYKSINIKENKWGKFRSFEKTNKGGKAEERGG